MCETKVINFGKLKSCRCLPPPPPAGPAGRQCSIQMVRRACHAYARDGVSAEKLIGQKIHLQTIVEGYRIASVAALRALEGAAIRN
jgi:hypothetical protein